jgi:hypothetical protein
MNRQIYFYETEKQTERRMELFNELKEGTCREISAVMESLNPYVHVYCIDDLIETSMRSFRFQSFILINIYRNIATWIKLHSDNSNLN